MLKARMDGDNEKDTASTARKRFEDKRHEDMPGKSRRWTTDQEEHMKTKEIEEAIKEGIKEWEEEFEEGLEEWEEESSGVEREIADTKATKIKTKTVQHRSTEQNDPKPIDRYKSLEYDKNAKKWFKVEHITLREEQSASLQKYQRDTMINWSKRENQFFYLNDVLPRTWVVHKQQARREFDIDRCLYIVNKANGLEVYDAPSACCRIRTTPHPLACGERYNYSRYTPMTKWDMGIAKETLTKPVIPYPGRLADSCLVCHKEDHGGESSLFSLWCGHLACRKCWLPHCTFYIVREFTSIPCINPTCGHPLTSARAGLILSDSALGIMRHFEFETLRAVRSTLQCGGCSRLLRANYTKMPTFAVCDCRFVTCTRCLKHEHSPLSCADHKRWLEMRNVDFNDESFVNFFNLSEEQFNHCLEPKERLESQEWKDRLKFIKRCDRTNGIRIEHLVNQASYIVEMQRVQGQAGLRSHVEPKHRAWLNQFEVAIEPQLAFVMNGFGIHRENAEKLQRLCYTIYDIHSQHGRYD